MLAPLKVVVPAPNFVSVPVPVMFWLIVMASERLMVRLPLSVMPLLDAILPVVPPLPICKVPELMVVVPV